MSAVFCERYLITETILRHLLSVDTKIPMKTHIFRLKPGSDLRNEIQKVVNTLDIKAGWILTCLGSLTSAHIRFANQPDGRHHTNYFEITSLTGTLSRNGSHLHISISDAEGKTLGGHLLEGSRVYTTAEIVIGYVDNLVFTREKDGSTNWPELQINPVGDDESLA